MSEDPQGDQAQKVPLDHVGALGPQGQGVPRGPQVLVPKEVLETQESPVQRVLRVQVAPLDQLDPPVVEEIPGLRVPKDLQVAQAVAALQVPKAPLDPLDPLVLGVEIRVPKVLKGLRVVLVVKVIQALLATKGRQDLKVIHKQDPLVPQEPLGIMELKVPAHQDHQAWLGMLDPQGHKALLGLVMVNLEKQVPLDPRDLMETLSPVLLDPKDPKELISRVPLAPLGRGCLDLLDQLVNELCSMMFSSFLPLVSSSLSPFIVIHIIGINFSSLCC